MGELGRLGKYPEIYGQRFASTGARSGSEFMINTYVTSNHRYPAVAIDGDGDFIVAWHSYEQEGVFNFGGIYAQRFNSSGAKVGGEFHVNTYIPKVQANASVAAETNGDFVIVWDSRGDPDNTYGIRAKRYTSAGAALGGEFAVNTYTTGTQYRAAMAMDSDGDFVVIWTSYKSYLNTEIIAQRFNSSGSALAGEFQVNTYTPGFQSPSFVPGSPRAVAMDTDGDFVVVWTSPAQDGSSYGVFGKRFTSAGAAVGTEFQVNTFFTCYQVRGATAMETDGDFVVAWQSLDQDGSNYGVFGRRFQFGGGGGATPTATPTRTPTVTPSPTGPTPTPTSTPTVTPTVTPGGKKLDIDATASVDA